MLSSKLSNRIAGLLFGTLALVAGIKFLSKQMKKPRHVTGQVEMCWVYRRSFHMTLNYGTMLDWYTFDRDYTFLTSAIHRGDTVTVDYVDSDLFTLTKGTDKLITRDPLFNKELILGVVCVLAGVGFYWLGFFYKKYR